MKYSQSFFRTTKETPKEAKAISHKLLLKGGFIHSLGSGFYILLPMGFRVWEKIRDIIKEELNKIGVEDVRMTVVMPAKTWKESERFNEIGPELWKIKNRFKEDFVLGLTHEEIFTDAAKKIIKSYKDLPLLVGQIHTKIRDEARARGGLLRTREFTMQDAYSFDRDRAGLEKSYAKFEKAYRAIFKRVGTPIITIESDVGAMGGWGAEEFMMLAKNGEDKIVICQKCKYAFNAEILGIDKDSKEGVKKGTKCPHCGSAQLVVKRGIEVGNIFKLGTKYSEKQNLFYTDKKGKRRPVVMGSYGIGLERLIASIVEASHDAKGIIWPKSVAPFKIYLISIGNTKKAADKLYNDLIKKKLEVFYDDREEISAGEKFADADLIGIPYRVTISDKTLKKGKVEIKKRNSKQTKLVALQHAAKILRDL